MTYYETIKFNFGCIWGYLAFFLSKINIICKEL